MGIVIRQSILTSVISYTGVAVGYANLLYLYPRFLEPEEIGLLRTITDVAILLAPFAQVGLAQSITRFYPHFARDKSNSHSFINLILLLSLAGYGLFVLVFYSFEKNILSFFKENAASLTGYTHLILWLIFFLMVIIIMEFYSRALLKIVFPNLLREVGIRLMQAILVSLYFLKAISFQQFLIFSVFIYLISLVILIGYLTYYGHLGFSLPRRFIPRGKVKEILTYSLLSLVGSGSVAIIGKLDSIMVTGLAGYASNAIYTTAFYIATVIEIPKRAITQTSTTLIANAFERHDMEEIQSVYRKTAINQLIVGALLLLGIWANLENLFQLMPKGDFFQSGMYVVLVVGMAKLVDMSFGPNGEIIILSKYYWFNMVTLVVLAGTGIVTNYLFIPMYGIIGAAYATAIALIAFNLIKWAFVFFKLKLQPFNGSFVKVLLIAGLVALINLQLPKVDIIFIDIAYRSSIIALIYGTLILVSKSSDEVSKVFYSTLRWLGWKSSK